MFNELPGVRRPRSRDICPFPGRPLAPYTMPNGPTPAPLAFGPDPRGEKIQNATK